MVEAGRVKMPAREENTERQKERDNPRALVEDIGGI